MKLINFAKLRTALLAIAAVLVVGWIARTDYKLQRSAEARVLTLEHKVDSLLRQGQEQAGINEISDRVAAAVGVLVVRAPDEINAEAYEAMLVKHARQDSLRAARATMRFIMSDSSVVLGTWADVQDRVWDIRRAEPLWKPDSTEIVK